MKKLIKTINYKVYIVLTLIILAAVLIIFITHNFKSEKNTEKFYDCDHTIYANAPIEPSDILEDKNDIQIIHAQKNGLKHPFKTDEQFENEIGKYVDNCILVKVTDNTFCHVKPLTHSQPYLIPEALDMLNEIGYKFQSRLKEKKLKNYGLVLTSFLRTEETQQKLTHRNHNATEHSCHIYGTTVDISYKNFFNYETDTLESSWEAIQELTKTLIEMRRECKLLAVREHKQSCFHVTVVVCQGKPNKKIKTKVESK